LFEVEGTTNAVRVVADPLGELSITGPGAGPELAGQGVLSDLIALSA
jgi:homoserine dehydrogenase